MLELLRGSLARLRERLRFVTSWCRIPTKFGKEDEMRVRRLVLPVFMIAATGFAIAGAPSQADEPRRRDRQVESGQRQRVARSASRPAETRRRLDEQRRGRPGSGRVPASLARRHQENVENAIVRLLGSGVLSPTQEYWTRQGLEKFLEAPLGAQGDVHSGWNGDADVFERNVQLERLSSPSTYRAVSPTTDETIFAAGRLTCFVGDTLVLNGRFLVVATWSNPFNGTAGIGLGCGLTPASGYFFFGLDRSNVELPIKMLNACFGGSPPSHWVLAAGLTNFGVQMTVIDGITGISRTYNNPPGTDFSLIIDQSTPFPCP